MKTSTRLFYGLISLSLVAGLNTRTLFSQTVNAILNPDAKQIIQPETGEENRQGARKQVPYELYKPIPMPEVTAPIPRDTDPGDMIIYDPETKQERIIKNDPALFNKLKDMMPGNPGIGGPQSQAEQEYMTDNFGSLSLIANPEDHPWRMNCKIYMTFVDGGGGYHYYVGSAGLIDQKHCLTAGHCVYDQTYGWATDIKVVPGYENGNEPYGNAYRGTLLSWTAWTSSGDWNHDMGVIELDRPVGALTGYFGYGWNSNNSFFTSNIFYNAQYPAESPYNGQYQYYWHGTYDDVYTDICYFDQYSYGGQSGSVAYVIDGDNRTVYCEQSHRSYYSGAWHSGQPRITESKFNSISDFISNHTPTSLDLVALNAVIAPLSIPTGQTSTSLTFKVYNNSSASWSGDVFFDIYLSTNDIISTSDTWLSGQFFNYAITPGLLLSINCVNVTIPWAQSAGDYYVGMIITNSDVNNGNNATMGWDAAPVAVTEGQLPAPASITCSDGLFYSYVNVDWPNVSGATHYQVFRNTTSNSVTATPVTGWITNSYYNDYGAAPGTVYYYWVKAAANSSGYASSVFSGTDYGYRNGDLNCLSPVTVYCGTPYNGNTGAGNTNIAMYPVCVSWNESGPEVVHEVHVYNPGTLTATLANLSADLDVFILGSCDKTNCLSYADWDASYPVVTPGTYYIVVDGYFGASGTYTLTVTCPPVPYNRNIQNETLYSGEYWCYDATNDLYVAGPPTVFTVHNGAGADLIAGHSIHLYAGTTVVSGGYLHAWISSNYCGYIPPPSMMANPEPEPIPEPLEQTILSERPVETGASEPLQFRVYPNPTDGTFVLQIFSGPSGETYHVEVMTLLGNTVLRFDVEGISSGRVDMSGNYPGLYVIKVTQGQDTATQKIILY
jgi:V8-like Glu-specific endopeptidase